MNGSVNDLLLHLKDKKGSDLHLTSGLEPRIRRHGHLEKVEGWPVIDDAAMRKLLRPVLGEARFKEFETTKDMDFSYGIDGVARFRSNAFVQENGAGAVFRIIPEAVLTLEDLKLPPAVETFAHLERGLALVTGPTGSGKSTTLAAIIDKINSTYAKHIITIEDPVEFVHRNKLSVFSQREIGVHTKSFASALKAAIRQDAEVVVVGEMRDLETISLAITAAEMGCLVFGTLHTASAPKTIDRLIDVFPYDQQPQVRMTLSESLAGVIAQFLMRTSDGKGRIAANEILLKTPALPNLIREGKTSMITSLIQGSKGLGMQSMDEALLGHVRAGKIDMAEAYTKASNKALFDAKGGGGGHDA